MNIKNKIIGFLIKISEKGIVWINLNKVEWIKLEPTQKKEARYPVGHKEK